MKGVTMTRKEIIKFARKVFDTVNGVINPTLLSSGITFSGKGDIIIDKEHPIASHICLRVFFNPDALIALQIEAYLEYGEAYSKDDVKGIIVEAVVHELSHVNQDIDSYLFDKDLDYRAKTESANELNTALFIAKTKDALQDALGEFTTFYDMPYNKECPAKLADYRQVVNIRKNLFSLLKTIFNGRIHDLLTDMKDRYHSLRFKVVRLRKTDFIDTTPEALLEDDEIARQIFLLLEKNVYMSKLQCLRTGVVVIENGLEMRIEMYDDREVGKVSQRTKTMVGFGYSKELQSYRFNQR